jgi:hypothetical protein
MFKTIALLLLLVVCWAPGVRAETLREASKRAVIEPQPLMAYVQSKPIRICNKVGISVHVGMQMLDYGTTMFAMGTGRFIEANPAMKWAAKDPLKMGVAKAVVAVGSSLLLAKGAQNHPKVTCAASLGMSAIAGYAVHSNVNQIKAWRRRQ